VSSLSVGRQAEAALLRRVLTGPGQRGGVGGPRGAVITGDAGIGKTHLASVVIAAARAAGHECEYVRCFAGAAAGTAAGFSAGSVTGFLTGSATPQHGAGAATRPAVLWIDDAHLLDAVTAVTVAQAAASGRIRVLATVREAVALPEPLRDMLLDGDFTRVALGPLGADDVALLLADAVGGQPAGIARDTVREITRVSGGNPLFVRELLLDARSAGTLRQVPAPGGWTA
jgi:predicted ATPase